MKYIFLIGNETPMDLLLLSLFLREAPSAELMVGVQRRTLSNWKGIVKVWRVFLKSDVGFVGLNVLLNSGIGRTLMLDGDIVAPDVETLKKQYGFTLFNFDDVNGRRALSEMSGFEPDVIFNHMPQRIRGPLIKIPRNGIVNIHPGLLPEYQGMGSCLWPLINEAPFHGSTLHYIDSEEIDAGPIIASGRFPIQERDSVFSLHMRCRMIAATLAAYVADRFNRGEEVRSRPQGKGTYHKLPGRESLKLMRSNGHAYIARGDRKILKDRRMTQFDFLDENSGWEWKPWSLRDGD